LLLFLPSSRTTEVLAVVFADGGAKTDAHVQARLGGAKTDANVQARHHETRGAAGAGNFRAGRRSGRYHEATAAGKQRGGDVHCI